MFRVSAAGIWALVVDGTPDPEVRKRASTILSSAPARLAGEIGFDMRRHSTK